MRHRLVLILTNCTNRKRGAIPRQLSARSLPKATYELVSTEWARRLEAAASSHVADELYCGRAVTETLEAARAVAGEVIFLSAGLGVVPQAQRIPAYNLTTSAGLPDSIGARLSEPYSPAQWWRELQRARGARNALTRTVLDRDPDLLLTVLPSGYLAMVGHDLEQLPARILEKMRIIGPRRAAEVPQALRRYWLPYDWRLDSPATGFNGTTADFPHRALRHFTTALVEHGPSLSLQKHRDLVESALSQFTAYVPKRGARASDAEVLAVIKRLWEQCAGNRSKVLRELRAHSGIACEQSRFRRLADQFQGKT